MPISLKIKDRVILKKSHPCGGVEFEIVRAGMDFRIKCINCEKEVWISRINLEKRVKKVIPFEE